MQWLECNGLAFHSFTTIFFHIIFDDIFSAMQFGELPWTWLKYIDCSPIHEFIILFYCFIFLSSILGSNVNKGSKINMFVKREIPDVCIWMNSFTDLLVNFYWFTSIAAERFLFLEIRIFRQILAPENSRSKVAFFAWSM